MHMQNPRAMRRKLRGFTLIEIMIVVVILGILASIVVPKFMSAPDQAKVTKAKQDIRAVQSALDMYRLDNHNYPKTDEGLEALTKKPSNAARWREGGYFDKLPKDPWGKEYQYLSPGQHLSIDIYSLGADGAQGGEGMNADIGNWNLDE